MSAESTQHGDRIDTLFVAIGVALVALSAVVLAATMYFSIGLPGVDSVAPGVLGTLVFTLLVAAVYRLTRRFAPGRRSGPRRLGR